ncbi:hypothetical protein AX17_003836 [Amanita inopinata Kibby_2008]|nr:hypothetical protein AX17_003836 [Amanita inopinata Kibby_2008]
MQNSSGESKTCVYKHIAEKLLPLYVQHDPDTYTQVKSKWESLHKQYQEHAKCLLQTGGGPETGDEQTPQYKVPVTGPDAGTANEAQNLWGKLYFSLLQTFELISILFQKKLCRNSLSFPSDSHPNLNPVVITTGVGPHGREVMNFHGSSTNSPAPSTITDDMIDPILQDVNPTPSHPTPTPPSAQALSTSTTAPSSSSQLEAAITKASTSISCVSKKCTLEETFMMIQGKTLKLAKACMKDNSTLKKHKLAIQEWQLLLQEFENGLITREEYCHYIRKLDIANCPWWFISKMSKCLDSVLMCLNVC